MHHGNNNTGNNSRNGLQILLSLSNQRGLTGRILHLSLKIRTGKQLPRRQPKHPPNPLKQFQQPRTTKPTTRSNTARNPPSARLIQILTCGGGRGWAAAAAAVRLDDQHLRRTPRSSRSSSAGSRRRRASRARASRDFLPDSDLRAVCLCEGRKRGIARPRLLLASLSLLP
jgi:hypothetical protein